MENKREWIKKKIKRPKIFHTGIVLQKYEKCFFRERYWLWVIGPTLLDPNMKKREYVNWILHRFPIYEHVKNAKRGKGKFQRKKYILEYFIAAVSLHTYIHFKTVLFIPFLKMYVSVYLSFNN